MTRVTFAYKKVKPKKKLKDIEVLREHIRITINHINDMIHGSKKPEDVEELEKIKASLLVAGDKSYTLYLRMI